MAAWGGGGTGGGLAGWVGVLGLVTCCSSWSLDLGRPLSGQSQPAGPPLHSPLTAHPWLHLKHEGKAGPILTRRLLLHSFFLTEETSGSEGHSLHMPCSGAFSDRLAGGTCDGQDRTRGHRQRASGS